MTLLPRSRNDDLMMREVGDELVVYDLRAHRVHLLNVTASLVWRYCDGKTAIEDVAALLGSDLDLPVRRRAVSLALDELAEAALLEGPRIVEEDEPSLSRRDLVRRVGTAALIAMPLVQSIAMPPAAATPGSSGDPGNPTPTSTTRPPTFFCTCNAVPEPPDPGTCGQDQAGVDVTTTTTADCTRLGFSCGAITCTSTTTWKCEGVIVPKLGESDFTFYRWTAQSTTTTPC